ncbi:kinase-like protein [Coprinopsis marcescibilis]|uniref:Kinase-like protein n=1 Tax=Coprinopsis marcescibilis TaxID=230819 RepID=A0A5C3KGF2_COPMA|nr:kinase-like protein [Coprinopsis marcescibilis]
MTHRPVTPPLAEEVNATFIVSNKTSPSVFSIKVETPSPSLNASGPSGYPARPSSPTTPSRRKRTNLPSHCTPLNLPLYSRREKSVEIDFERKDNEAQDYASLNDNYAYPKRPDEIEEVARAPTLESRARRLRLYEQTERRDTEQFIEDRPEKFRIKEEAKIQEALLTLPQNQGTRLTSLIEQLASQDLFPRDKDTSANADIKAFQTTVATQYLANGAATGTSYKVIQRKVTASDGLLQSADGGVISLTREIVPLLEDKKTEWIFQPRRLLGALKLPANPITAIITNAAFKMAYCNEGSDGNREIGLYKHVGPKPEDIGWGIKCADIWYGWYPRSRTSDFTAERLVVLKSYLKSSDKVANRQFVLRNELRAQRRLAAKSTKMSLFVLAIDACVEDNEHYFLVMPQMYCSLLDLFRKPKKYDIDIQKHGRRWAAQLATAISHGHQSGLIHRDVSPSNILITHSLTIKPSDFALAWVSPEHSAPLQSQLDNPSAVYAYKFKGTTGYTAPEVMKTRYASQCKKQAYDSDVDEEKRNRAVYGPAADWFSIGVVLAEMMQLGEFWNRFPTEALYTEFIGSSYEWRSRFLEEFGLKGRIMWLVRGLLKPDPKEHYDYHNIFRHPFFDTGSNSSSFDNIAEHARRQPIVKPHSINYNLQKPKMTTMVWCGMTPAQTPALERADMGYAWINLTGRWARPLALV